MHLCFSLFIRYFDALGVIGPERLSQNCSRPSNMWLKLSAVMSTEFESTLTRFYSTANLIETQRKRQTLSNIVAELASRGFDAA